MTVRRVLLTGASGFVGRPAVLGLVRCGFEVHAVARSAPPRSPVDGVTWHALDLLDGAARRALLAELRASHLLHLAWYAEPGAYWEARENASWVAASIGLVEEFHAAGGARAALAGTCAEYDWSAPQPLSENAPLAPATYYGACKDATRRVAEGLAERVGLSLAWGRLFFLYGPGEDERRLVAGIVRALVAGERAPISAGLQRRDYLHVDDVAGALVAILDCDVAGAVNVASGEAVTVGSIAAQVADDAGRPDLLDVGALPDRPGDPGEISADVARLRDEVGFTPARTLAEGLADTVRWWGGQPRR